MTLIESSEIYAAARPEMRKRRSHLERIFSVLAAFQENSRLGLAELTRRVNLPKTTVHRIVHELLGVGVLTHDGDNYRVGVRLFEISMAAPYAQLRDAAAPVLRHLTTTTQSTVGLAILDGTDAVFLDRVLGKNDSAGTAFARPGLRLPAYSCAAGKVLLATGNSHTLAAPSTATMRRLAPKTFTDTTRLAQELASVRHRRIAIEDDESAIGLMAMAAAIPNTLQHGESCGAVTMRGPFHNNERAADILRRAARIIGDRLCSAYTQS